MMNDKKAVRSHLISAGVKNLKVFGYPDVNDENILTDSIYKALFHSMLEDNLGQSDFVDIVINELMAEIEP